VPFSPGTRLGAYEVVGLLGAGGMGEVYRARAETHDRLWPGTFVSEASLRQVVMELRRALGDDPREPRCVRTVRRFGYAFTGEARELLVFCQAGAGTTRTDLG